MKTKAFFIAPFKHEATHWARLWGYSQNEWRYIGSVDKLYGFDPSCYTVFVCGSHPPAEFDEIWDRLMAIGFTVYDAQDIDIPDNIENGTEWLI